MAFHLLPLLWITSFAAVTNCNAEHSSFYNTNSGQSFFIPQTFMQLSNADPCETISNSQFRNENKQYLTSNLDTEHIIDLSNSESELAHCNKNIRGNMVLANSNWNRGVGNLCWKYAKSEKRSVYGNIFNQAENNVRVCCGYHPLMSYELIIVICVCVIIALVILAIGFIFLCGYIKSQDEVDLVKADFETETFL